jgi:hypothetical protein
VVLRTDLTLQAETPSKQNTMSRKLKHLPAGVSLVILALGFCLLGALSFISRAQGNVVMVSDLENNCCWLGGGVSIFAGVIFLVAACAYWRR